MALLDLAKLEAATVATAPYAYTIVPGFLAPDGLRTVVAGYPPLKAGSYPLEEVPMTPALRALIEALDGPEFERIVEKKFAVGLAGKPKMYSLRGYTRAKDGQIHTDSKDKIITVLLYLNEHWNQPGGRLRLLRSGRDVEDYMAEVPPDNGTLLIFKRSETSWHGHHPFDGPRRSLQMNWMTSEGSKGFHAIRHKISATFKKLTAA